MPNRIAPAWTIGIDVGGTFTDLHATDASTGREARHKTPSTPANPAQAILAGIAELCRREAIAPGDIARVSHGSTVATNALIQRRGGRVALVVTKGFRDLLEIGRQIRPRIYDFQTDHPPPLVPRALRFEAAERITRGGRVITPLDPAEITRIVEAVRQSGADACAICLLFSFVAPAHERAIAAALRAAMPDLYLSVSSEVQPEFREYERLSTTVLNAYLQPVMSAYLAAFEQGADALAPGARLGISQSSGGLISARRARDFPIRTALSGPAAGVAGAVRVSRAAARHASAPEAAAALGIITLDIGGTSSDIALIRDHTPGTVFERWIEGYPARMPSVDINAIGAGGGSIAWLDQDGLLKVGPQSAGASPGPACYGLGGTAPTVSDANLVLGRLSANGLLGGAMPLQPALAEAAIDALAGRIGLGRAATALGIVDIAVATMVRGIRTVSIERGHDPRQCTLLAFGGAGPLHAAAVARSLGIRTVLVPSHPGLLCAEGLLAADHLEHFVSSLRLAVEPAAAAAIDAAVLQLRARAQAWFESEAIATPARQTRLSLDMRYVGQNFELNVPFDDALDADRLRHAFYAVHDRAYGFHNPGAPVEIVGIRLVALGSQGLAPPRAAAERQRPLPPPRGHRPVRFTRDDAPDTPVFQRADLVPGDVIAGPAVVEQFDSTTIVFPGDSARVDGHATLVMEIGA